MSTFLGWLLLLGGIVIAVLASVFAADVEFELALALGGLLSTLAGATVLLLARVAGDTPPDMRPPGASAGVRAPTAGPPSGRPLARRGRRSLSAGPASMPAVAAPSTPSTVASGSVADRAIPTGPAVRSASRLPLLAAAFIAGIAWDLTGGGERDGPLDLLAGVVLLATPVAIFVAVATWMSRGRAWGPAVTFVMAAGALLLGGLAAGFLLDLLG